MKSIIMWKNAEKQEADVILHFDENILPSDLCTSLWVMLEEAARMDGFELTCDFYEISKEIKAP